MFMMVMVVLLDLMEMACCSIVGDGGRLMMEKGIELWISRRRPPPLPEGRSRRGRRNSVVSVLLIGVTV